MAAGSVITPEKEQAVKDVLKGWYDSEGFGGAAHGAAQVAAAIFGLEWVETVELEWKTERGKLGHGPTDGVSEDGG